MTNVEKYLTSVGKQVVSGAKSILKNSGKSGKLEKSITYEVVPVLDGFSLRFYMTDYGKFVDKGVSGNKKIQEYTTFDKRTIESPYKYTSKQPPADILAKWISRKKIKGRDKKTGRFITNLSLAYIFAKKIKRDGLKSLSFFQKPLGEAWKNFEVDLAEALKKDITDKL